MHTLNQAGRSPLFSAAHEGHTPVVALLLNAEADVNLPDKVRH